MSANKAMAEAVANRAKDSGNALKTQGDGWIAIQRNTFSNWMNTKVLLLLDLVAPCPPLGCFLLS